jgi:outer membrane protein OmpA-like peptidoglycan-associated protein
MARDRFLQAVRVRGVSPALASAVVALLVLVAGARVEAQESGATLDQYRAAETSADGFAISRPDDLGRLRFSAQLHLDYASDPLEYEEHGDNAVVANQLVGHFAFALGLIDRLVVFAGLPVTFFMNGDNVPGELAPEGSMVGDLYVGLRGRIYGEQDDIFAIGAQATVTAPIADAAADPAVYAGESNFSGHLEILAELRLRRVRLTFNLGSRFREPIHFPSATVGHELTYGVGLTVNIVDRWLLGQVEVYGASPFRNFAAPEVSPLEALIGGIVTIGDHWRLGLAAGPGLTNGFGAPDVRVVLNLGYTTGHPTVREPEPEPQPEPGPVDQDGDGILDDADQCPTQAEDRDGFEDENGCPDADNDGDGLPDATDQCPNEAEDVDQFEDENGCADADNDGDGLLDAADRCPNEAEDVDQFEDTDGCPDLDNDQDTVPDATDECPIAPGAPEANGCPRTIRVEGDQIVILQRIEFANNSDRLLPPSMPILEEVRAVLAANPQIASVRIEGHTDNVGRDDRNLDLSQRRAESVKRWLVEHGIEESRLTAEGLGETRPIADNTTPAGRQTNRRVEFHLVQNTSAPAEPPTE